MGAAKAAAQHAPGRPGGRSQVENAASLDAQRFQSSDQPLTRRRVHEVGVIEGRGGTIETTLYVTRAKHSRTVARFLHVPSG